MTASTAAAAMTQGSLEEQAYPHATEDRIGMTMAFSILLDAVGDPSGYGKVIRNETFEMQPYCWCESNDCAYCGSEVQPNFWHKPTDLRLRWYKYPLRSAVFNRPCSLEEFQGIVASSLEALMPPVGSSQS